MRMLTSTSTPVVQESSLKILQHGGFCALQDRDGSIYLILIYLSLSKNEVLHAPFYGHPNVSNDGV